MEADHFAVIQLWEADRIEVVGRIFEADHFVVIQLWEADRIVVGAPIVVAEMIGVIQIVAVGRIEVTLIEARIWAAIGFQSVVPIFVLF